MDAGENWPEKMHFLLFPWLAFGHLLPFHQLAKCLASRGHAVTFISTPNNIRRLPPLPANLADRVRFVSLPLPRVEGLPEGAEATTDVPPDKVPLLKAALDLLDKPFSEFFDREFTAAADMPDWIILDIFHHWLTAIAAKHDIPCAMFYVFPAVLFAFVGPLKAINDGRPRTKEDFLVSPPWIPAASKVAYRRHIEAAMWAEGAFGDNGTGMTDVQRYSKNVEGCSLLSFRTCFELEAPWLALLEQMYEKPVVPPGLVLMLPDKDDHPAAPGSAPGMMTWLDEQPAKSVVYVALGSEAPLSTKLVHELALGLELSGVRFLWALRKPKAGPAVDENAGILPEGFEDRTSDRGLVVMGWVPQIRVLAHGSVGAFLTHCGWGSTIEGLHFGLPLIMLPIVLDQPLVAQVMEAKGVGVEIPRDEVDATFDRDGVAKTVRRVMTDGEMAQKAEKLREEVFGNVELQEKQFDLFLEHMRLHKSSIRTMHQ